MTIEAFTTQVAAREMPSNPMAQVQTLARELAEGAVLGLWPTSFDSFGIYNEGRRENDEVAQAIYAYMLARWDGPDNAPDLTILERNGFLSLDKTERFAVWFSLLKPAFDLLSTAEAATIFISYKRSESSSLALLIDYVLRDAGLNPYVDMQLQAGGDWRLQLRDKIQQADYLVLLLAPTSLQSTVILEEAQWAIDSGTTIIPVWHRDFRFSASDWPDLNPTLSDTFAHTHTLRVTEENPLAYQSMLSELLNRFGINR